jgi:hypothetical protein
MIERIQEVLVNLDKARSAGVVSNSRRDYFKAFLLSIRTQVASGKKLSAGQNKYLNDIERQCSEEEIKLADEWIQNYSDDLRDVAIMCAEYYESNSAGGNYFRDIRNKVLENPKGHTLSKKEFNAMCANKYAVKIINEMKSDNKFKVGQIVEVRSTNRLDMAPYDDRSTRQRAYQMGKKAMRGERVYAMVIGINTKPMYRAVSGGKVYSIIIPGSTLKLLACEKDLKKARRT